MNYSKESPSDLKILLLTVLVLTLMLITCVGVSCYFFMSLNEFQTKSTKHMCQPSIERDEKMTNIIPVSTAIHTPVDKYYKKRTNEPISTTTVKPCGELRKLANLK